MKGKRPEKGAENDRSFIIDRRFDVKRNDE